MSASSDRRVSVKLTNPDLIAEVEKNGIQAVLDPLIEAGYMLKKTGVLPAMESIKANQDIEQMGYIEAIQASINFIKGLSSDTESPAAVESAVDSSGIKPESVDQVAAPTPSKSKEELQDKSVSGVSDAKGKSIATPARKAAFQKPKKS